MSVRAQHTRAIFPSRLAKPRCWHGARHLLVARIGAGRLATPGRQPQQFPNLFRRVFAEGACSAFCHYARAPLEAKARKRLRWWQQEAIGAVRGPRRALTISRGRSSCPWVLLLIHGGQVTCRAL